MFHTIKNDFTGISLESLNQLTSPTESKNRKSQEFLRLITDLEVNTATIQQHLQIQTDFDINFRNNNGASALHMAIKMQKADLIQVLLQHPKIQVAEDIMLYAVQEGNISIVDTLMKHQSSNQDVMDFDLSESVHFMVGMTPLMVACMNSNYKMAKFLLSKGAHIEKPHKHSCKCHRCRKNKSKDPITTSQIRLNIYRALTTPTLLALSSEFTILETNDPIYNSFILHKELKKLAKHHDQYKKEYEECAECCSNFAVDLLDNCRTMEEVELLLKQKYGSKDPRSKIYHRLFLAFELKQKKFVCHRHFQDVFESCWTGVNFDWQKKNHFQKFSRILFLLGSFPFICFFRIMNPSNHYKLFYQTPKNRFIYYIFSNIAFLTILFVDLFDNDPHLKKLTSWKKWTLLSWIIGLMWQHMTFIRIKGLQTFLRLRWKSYDLLMIFLFLLSYVTWIASYIRMRVMSLDMNLPREKWPGWDPILISESIFSIASILAFVRILDLFQLNTRLGPLSLSLSKMIQDIIYFMFIFFLIMFAFANGLNTIYKHYISQTKYISDSEVQHQPEYFTTLLKTYKTLFWSLFGYGDADSPAIVLSNTTKTDAGTLIDNENQHYFTEVVGYFLFGLYHIVAVIVLLNMLVAMMANTFEIIHNNTDLEWKFARSLVKLDFFEDYTSMPPPFNLIPSLKNIADTFKWFHDKCFTGYQTEKMECSIKLCCYLTQDLTKEDDERDNERYKILVQRLLQRYDSFIKRKETTEVVNKEMLETLKQEIKMKIDKLNALCKSHETVYKNEDR